MTLSQQPNCLKKLFYAEAWSNLSVIPTSGSPVLLKSSVVVQGAAAQAVPGVRFNPTTPRLSFLNDCTDYSERTT